jgi:hypothetical protein
MTTQPHQRDATRFLAWLMVTQGYDKDQRNSKKVMHINKNVHVRDVRSLANVLYIISPLMA